MKNVILTLCMFMCTVLLYAQQDSTAAPAWVTGEQESSFPGQTIKYAVTQSVMAVEGSDEPLVVSLNVMIFRGNVNYFLSVKGDLFVVENIQDISVQKTLVRFDDNKYNAYPLVGDNNYTASKLSFQSSYKNKFKKGLKNASKCSVILEFKNAGQQTFEFNISGLPQEFLE